jgi:APA family basic amino acid/polyamine antiporter
MKRPFKTPLVPIVPILGAVVCLGMIVAIDLNTLKFALVWMIIGLVVYFTYSRKRSKLSLPGEILPKASDFN